MKQTIKLRESELKRMISESVRRVLKETGFLSEGKFVNNKPIDWNKISDDDVDTVIKKQCDRHYNRPNGGDVLARRQKQLDAAKRLGMEGDELDVFPDTVQARTEFYRNHPWRKPYRDTYVFPWHMKRTNRLRESELRRMISESVKRVLREARNNRPLQDYADELTQKWRNSKRGSSEREDLWNKYQDLDRMERVHALRNGEFPTAEYQGETYTIDDPLPNATIFYHHTGAPYAWNAYPNEGESFRDYIEGRGESMEDVTDWWFG